MCPGTSFGAQLYARQYLRYRQRGKVDWQDFRIEFNFGHTCTEMDAYPCFIISKLPRYTPLAGVFRTSVAVRPCTGRAGAISQPQISGGDGGGVLRMGVAVTPCIYLACAGP